ncbi:MAG: hypothetical protein JW876_05570 [Candidatus Krumholzibacteriota bacterium]|nr:hypothetical protein [Candidatus Krumholzibacteriota bacterium]
MKVYLTDKDGVGILRLHGTVGADDVRRIVRSIAGRGGGCVIIDFEHVDHVDYRAFQLLDGVPRGAQLLLSGFSDYVLDIFAFAGKLRSLPVYPNWRHAFRHLMAERGKLIAPAAVAAAGR